MVHRKKKLKNRIELRINNVLLGKPAIEARWLVYRNLDPVLFAMGESLVSVRINGKTAEENAEMTIEKIELDVEYH